MPMPEIKDDILKRLDDLDELLSLNDTHNDDLLMAIIVGGAAMLVMGYIDRATKDIDFIEVSREAEKFLPDFDINTNAAAYLSSFPDDYEERLKPLPVGGRKIRYYAASLEDIVISKINSYRDKDMEDIRNQGVIKALNWDLLDKLAGEKMAYALNDTQRAIFKSMYDAYLTEKHSK
ncbi:DUF6036 family nucleotidyltransferase [Cloacibacillus sp.]|uniref:DUF6036 family nucleotidyltransferase n=1 Tax=Cloacibacillus sp. TaxID=2049023 RepID=UPI0025BD6834|nr:DUF6036 family nucleotidyltransferase [Cloacibacillus sp.]MCC8058502.1 hypothetical protein [Cloacibacillus sp.]